jgi:hypothetical protein
MNGFGSRTSRTSAGQADLSTRQIPRTKRQDKTPSLGVVRLFGDALSRRSRRFNHVRYRRAVHQRQRPTKAAKLGIRGGAGGPPEPSAASSEEAPEGRQSLPPPRPGPIAAPRELTRFQRRSFAYPVNLTTCALGG